MGIFKERRDPMNLNGTNRSIKVKVYISETYNMFGCGFEEHRKYLPCMAILERLSGDSFYDFIMLTEDGPIRSCGYGAFWAATDVTKKMKKQVWHLQGLESIEIVSDRAQPVVVLKGEENLMPTDEITVFESVDKVIDVIRTYDRWALIKDFVLD